MPLPVGQSSQEHAQVPLRKANSFKVGNQSLCAPLERRAAVAVACDAVPLGQLLLGPVRSLMFRANARPRKRTTATRVMAEVQVIVSVLNCRSNAASSRPNTKTKPSTEISRVCFSPPTGSDAMRVVATVLIALSTVSHCPGEIARP